VQYEALVAKNGVKAVAFLTVLLCPFASLSSPYRSLPDVPRSEVPVSVLRQTRYLIEPSEGVSPNSPTITAEDLEAAIERKLPDPKRVQMATRSNECPVDVSSCEVVTEEVIHQEHRLLFRLRVALVKPSGLNHRGVDDTWDCPIGGDEKPDICWELAPKHLATLLEDHDQTYHQRSP
jgi:hypothetical protein